jgi:phosphoglycolate phosphatase
VLDCRLVTKALVLLDIDGTLLRAGDRNHAAAFLLAIREVYDVPASLDGVPLAGMLDRQIARHVLAPYGIDQAAVDARLEEFTDAVGRHFDVLLAGRSLAHLVLDGVSETVARLHEHGAILVALTGNARGVAVARLRAAGLDDLIVDGAYGDEADERHVLVEIASTRARARTGVEFALDATVIVGDTPRDIEAAQTAGCRVVAVATGRFTVAELAEHDPDALLENMSDPDTAAAVILGVTGSR